MKIKFIATRRIGDGKTVQRFFAGQEYDVSDFVAREALKKGWAYNSEPFDVEPVKQPNMSDALFESVKEIAASHDKHRKYEYEDYFSTFLRSLNESTKGAL